MSLSPAGPVVIDWPNAARGDGMPTSASPGYWCEPDHPAGRVKATVMGWGRSFLITSMLDGFDVDAIREQLPAVVEWKDLRPPYECTRASWDVGPRRRGDTGRGEPSRRRRAEGGRYRGLRGDDGRCENAGSALPEVTGESAMAM